MPHSETVPGVARALTFPESMDHVAEGFEVLGVTVLVIGLVVAAVGAVQSTRTLGGHAGYQTARARFGSALLLGLEVLVAADLIRTVAVAPTLTNVGVLALIVLIRTFLSFSLELEIEGVLPWRRGSGDGRGRNAGTSL